MTLTCQINQMKKKIIICLNKPKIIKMIKIIKLKKIMKN